MVVETRVQATIVFQKTHDAIYARNPDGSRKYRYIIEEGSSRSSKTRSLIQIAHKACMESPGKRGSVWRATKKECKETVGKDVREVFPAMPLWHSIDFNETNATYSFPNGSVFEIQGTDDANKVHGYNCHFLWLNEPYEISKDTFDQLDMRTEDFVVIDWNPQGAHWIDDLKKDPRTIVIHSTFKDNPFCPPEQKRKILGYQPVACAEIVEGKHVTEDEARGYDVASNPKAFTDKQIRELIRCIDNERKKSADKYKWYVYGLGKHAEKPNRIFFWDEVPDHVYESIQTTKYIGVDWGTVDPWAVVEVKYYDGALYCHELNYKSENALREGIEPDVWYEIGQVEEGLMKWRFNQLGVGKKLDIICDNNRLMKIKALIDVGYDNAIPAFKGPGSKIDGINILKGLRVYYTTSSKNIETEQTYYSRRVDKYGVVEEEPEDGNDHMMDSLRYVAIYLSLMDILKK